jgi:cytochrome b
MIILLMISLAATVGTGLIVYAQEHGAGPLAPFIAHTQQAEGLNGVVREDANREEHESSLEEVHETLANVTLALVMFHVIGVILASFVHRENLVIAMLNGRKRAPGIDEIGA